MPVTVARLNWGNSRTSLAILAPAGKNNCEYAVSIACYGLDAAKRAVLSAPTWLWRHGRENTMASSGGILTRRTLLIVCALGLIGANSALVSAQQAQGGNKGPNDPNYPKLCADKGGTWNPGNPAAHGATLKDPHGVCVMPKPQLPNARVP